MTNNSFHCYTTAKYNTNNNENTDGKIWLVMEWKRTRITKEPQIILKWAKLMQRISPLLLLTNEKHVGSTKYFQFTQLYSTRGFQIKCILINSYRKLGWIEKSNARTSNLLMKWIKIREKNRAEFFNENLELEQELQSTMGCFLHR